MKRDTARYELVMAYDSRVSQAGANRSDFMDLCYACWYIRRGSVSLACGDAEQRARAGVWVFTEPFMPRSQRFSDDAEILSLRFRVDWRGLSYLPPIRPPRLLRQRRAPELLPLAEQIIACGAHLNTDADDCRLAARFHDWLSAWHRRRGAPAGGEQERIAANPRVNRLLTALAGHVGLGVIDYDRLRVDIGLSRAQIDRLSKAHLGLTPRQWCERRCLSQAERWLRAEAASIKEIAWRLRFVDASHFAKWFRRQTGMAPTEYRRQHWA
jgi:AraC-like DNA-binding protein